MSSSRSHFSLFDHPLLLAQVAHVFIVALLVSTANTDGDDRLLELVASIFAYLPQKMVAMVNSVVVKDVLQRAMLTGD